MLLVPVSVAWAQQEGTLAGRITDSQQGGLPQANILLQGTSYGGVTDEAGRFELPHIPTGQYTVEVRFMGYGTQTKNIVITAGKTTTLHFTLAEDDQLLEAVEVAGKSQTTLIREGAFNVTAIDTRKLMNATADINQVLNQTTGVRIRETGGLGSDFNFSLNGFSGKQIKFFLDGVPMANFGSSLTLNNFPVNLAERIEVYKGVVPIYLGSDALGGAVNVVTNQHIRNYLDASYSLGSFNTHRLSVNMRHTTDKGIQVGANLFGNYSDNDYTINYSVADTETGQFLPERPYKHFHDGYQSGSMIANVGVVDKPYADRLLLGVITSANKKEIQQGTTMRLVVGQAYSTSQAVMPTLNYQKSNLLPHLDASLYAAYNMTKNVAVDTSSRVYDWTGNYTIRTFGAETTGEMGHKTLYTYRERDAMTVTNLQYTLPHAQALRFNHTFSHYIRREEDDIFPERPLHKPRIDNHALGLSYENTLFDDRVSATVFAKWFIMQLTVPVDEDSAEEETSKHDQLGYGMALTWFVVPNVQTKLSYEDTYRMPAASELMGDGLSVDSNYDLEPEHSKNLNVGASYKTRKSGRIHGFQVDGSFIYRRAENFIRAAPQGAKVLYENLYSIRVAGGDASIQYSYRNFLFVEVNGTYQDIINTNKYDPPGSNVVSYTYKARLPNRPYLFGNGVVTAQFKSLWHDDDKLSVNLACNFVEAFYLYWPTKGDPDYKRDIPRQITQDVGITYSLAGGRYNVALQCRNITNTRVYDYFNIQKPGRSFSVKLRYFIRSAGS